MPRLDKETKEALFEQLSSFKAAPKTPGLERAFENYLVGVTKFLAKTNMQSILGDKLEAGKAETFFEALTEQATRFKLSKNPNYESIARENIAREKQLAKPLPEIPKPEAEVRPGGKRSSTPPYGYDNPGERKPEYVVPPQRRAPDVVYAVPPSQQGGEDQESPEYVVPPQRRAPDVVYAVPPSQQGVVNRTAEDDTKAAWKAQKETRNTLFDQLRSYKAAPETPGLGRAFENYLVEVTKFLAKTNMQSILGDKLEAGKAETFFEALTEQATRFELSRNPNYESIARENTAREKQLAKPLPGIPFEEDGNGYLAPHRSEFSVVKIEPATDAARRSLDANEHGK